MNKPNMTGLWPLDLFPNKLSVQFFYDNLSDKVELNSTARKGSWMSIKKPTPRNLLALAGERLQGATPKTLLGKDLGNSNISRLLPRVQDGEGGNGSPP
jgi:hypothetical protein